ncbi:MAG: hypothetical protein PHI18_03620 [bacterium]|nr:hypothetical protein [bacterium]
MESFPPIPAHPLLISHLLGLVFLIHVVFMNYVVAAPLLAMIYLRAKGEAGRLFARWLTAAVPVAFTFTINFGVASLLFVQVLYPERFYTANILLGAAWLGIVGMLMVAFYFAYIMQKWIANPQRSIAWSRLAGAIITVLVVGIAALMMSNYFIATEKSQWPQLVSQPWLVVKNLTFVPRLLHILIGSLAVTGLWMVWISWWRQRRGGPVAELQAFRRQGLQIATGATGLQIVVGVWFLLWLPSAAWDALFSGTFPSMVWIGGVACGLLLLGVLLAALANPDKIIWQRIATGFLFATLIGMVAGRDVIRRLAIGDDFHLASLPYRFQAEPFLTFALLLVVGLVTLLVLLRLIWRLPEKKE